MKVDRVLEAGALRAHAGTPFYFCALFCVLLGLAPGSAFGANFFSWDADSWVNSRGPCDKRRGTLDASTKHAGASSLRMSVVGSAQGTIGCDNLDNITLTPRIGWDSGKTIYHRFWMKLSPDFDWGRGFQKMKAARSFGSAGGTGFTLYLHKGHVALSECAECTPQGDGDNRLFVAYDFDPSTNPSVASWQEYIVAVRMQTDNRQNAAISLYVNGESIGEATGVRVRDCTSGCDDVQDANWGMFAQSFYPQLCRVGEDCARGGSVWVDDLSSDDVWNSILASSPEAPRPGSSDDQGRPAR